MWFINHICEIKILKNFGTYMEKALNGGLLDGKKFYREPICKFRSKNFRDNEPYFASIFTNEMMCFNCKYK